jgi:CheY-like chemotaxis protein
VGSDTGSSREPDTAQLLHRLRSTLARVKAELELAEEDGSAAPVARLLEDLGEAFGLLSEAEDAASPRLKVVVIDDDTRLGEVTARGLRRLGYEADSTGSLRSLRHGGEVLVIDLSLLKELDERDLAAIRAARPLIVTGAADRASRELAERVDASDYLVKPVDLQQLAAAIDRRAQQDKRST